ncbi:hypothetical protein BGY98DRAFT_1183851 [Russula aff. rugulosa BPL654]|nr:hypothetical protein BGY98DRAFT_1183851 [Russula aff. rugulosa BPL654]
MSSSRILTWKRHFPSNSAPTNESASRSHGQQLRFFSKSQSQSQSPRQTQQPQPLYPWSAHTPPSGQWPSPFPRLFHALSTTATAAGELFLFGGLGHSSESPRNDLYVISTRDFSTTLLQTSGDVPNPRYGHRAVLTSTILLIWGGMANFSDKIIQNQALDDSLYLLNLGTTSSIPVSREWTRIVVNGPGPGGRYNHTFTLVGSKLFVFGGRIASGRLNDIWALDLNCLKSNPFWESYEPAPGNEKPLPRSGHVSVTTGDHIIIFGGHSGRHDFNDTWSFNVSTRKWTELQCTGSVPSPRAGHAAVLVGDVMYVFGGDTIDGTNLGDLTAFNLSTQRWIAFQDIGPSPSGRSGHAMASDGICVFMLGGELSPCEQADETKPIHVLNIKHLDYREPDSDAVDPSEMTTQLVRRSSARPPTRGQPHQSSSSSSDAHATHEGLDRPTSLQITREQNPSLSGLPSRPTGASSRPRRVSEEDDHGKGSTEHHARLVAPNAPSKEITRLEDRRLIELERQLSETLVAKTERDWRIARLTDELVLKSVLLDQAAEEKKRAGLELRELRAKLDELLLSRDHAPEQTQSAFQEATFRAAEAKEQSRRELTEVHAKLEARESELAAVRLRLADTENGCPKSKAEADTYRNLTVTGVVNTDEYRVVHRLMERVQAMEVEMASLRWNEKSFEMMECRNEG